MNDDDGWPAHDPTLDQEALAGGQAARKRLTELPKDEAQKEIRWGILLQCLHANKINNYELQERVVINLISLGCYFNCTLDSLKSLERDQG